MGLGQDDLKRMWWEHGCCHACHPDDIECVHAVLQVAVIQAGLVLGDSVRLEPNVDDSRVATLARLMERCRFSGWWGLGESSNGELEASIRLLAEASLISAEQSQRIRALLYRWDPSVGVAEYLLSTTSGELGPVTVEDVTRLINIAQAEAIPDWPRPTDLDPDFLKRRPSYTQGEVRVAERLGLSEPPRVTIARYVREAAENSLTEADFIQELSEGPIGLVPFVAAERDGVLGYSGHLRGLPPEDRYSYGGKKLGTDLALHRLREHWGSHLDDQANGRQAWNHWLFHTGMQVIQDPPEPRQDGLWRWIHPDAISRAQHIGRPAQMPSTPHGRKREARLILSGGQGGMCAMCSIQRRNWSGAYPLVREGEHLDHDHETGLIRGLLCSSCNTYREPTGAKANDPVWAVYVENPPAAELGCAWPWD